MLILEFSTLQSMEAGLGRVHKLYEGGELKGNLKGVNFPYELYKKYVEKNVLTPEEKVVQKQIEKQTGITYIVGILKGDGQEYGLSPKEYKQTCTHETAHYRYYSDERYRKKVQKIWESLGRDVRVYIEKKLKELGYKDEKIVDEFQAYLIEDSKYFGNRVESSIVQKLISYSNEVCPKLKKL